MRIRSRSLTSVVLSIGALVSLHGAALGGGGVLRIGGAVPQPFTVTSSDLASMPRTTVTASAHHVTGTWDGVTVRELLSRAGVPSGTQLRGATLAASVVVTGADGYRAAFGLAEFDAQFTDRVAIIADRKDGAVLPTNAAPFQLIITGEKRPARWVRQVIAIELVSH